MDSFGQLMFGLHPIQLPIESTRVARRGVRTAVGLLLDSLERTLLDDLMQVIPLRLLGQTDCILLVGTPSS